MIVRTMVQSCLAVPRSQHIDQERSTTTVQEHQAIKDLLEELERRSGEDDKASETKDFIEFHLDDFTIYLPPDHKLHPYELRPLHDLATRRAHEEFLFDGVLSAGEVSRRVKGVAFQICSIGNYGVERHEVGGEVWVQSRYCSVHGGDVWSRLGKPHRDYRRVQESFMWVANLAKHFVDYGQAEGAATGIGMREFEGEFAGWMVVRYGGSRGFRGWYEGNGGADFRNRVVACRQFLFKECMGVNGDKEDGNPMEYAIWKQVIDQTFVPRQPLEMEDTVVTPYVWNLFSRMDMARCLWCQRPTAEVLRLCGEKGIRLDVSCEPSRGRKKNKSKTSERASRSSNCDSKLVTHHEDLIKSIRVGDVVAVEKEAGIWADSQNDSQDHWLIYVQAIDNTQSKERFFLGIWMYEPEHTHCASGKYPYPNELFFSNHCTDHDKPLLASQIVGVVKVVWHGQPETSGNDRFVRQTYLDQERFVTFRDEHKICEHLRIPVAGPKFPKGQTVLATPFQQEPKYELEPYEIFRYITKGTRETVVLRKLLRRCEMKGQGKCRPNELVYTQELFTQDAAEIDRECLVRFYSQDDVVEGLVPAPYCRDGTGDAFYISTQLTEIGGSNILRPIHDDLPSSLMQGFDPSEVPAKKLRGLDLFCGGGNFGRGLEEGGAVEITHAIDIGAAQIHTYYTNLKDPTKTKLFHGSVNDLLSQALQGNPNKIDLIPSPGEIDIIIAGSPCQGFSNMNNSKNNRKGLKNQSLIASVAAYVDFYRPKYGILENVLGLARSDGNADKDVCSQLVCALVGLGYQLEIFLIAAWSCGSPQSRDRLFISFAAPGVEPLQYPASSHSKPSNIRERSIGKLQNGSPIARRRNDRTPFNFCSIGLATSDLQDPNPSLVPHADHVVPISVGDVMQRRIQAIPIYPRGSNLVSAFPGMTNIERALFPGQRQPKNGSAAAYRRILDPRSVAFGRVDPSGILQTVKVEMNPLDHRMGSCLHWDEQRPLTILECRRAQSFPDNEVLVGSLAQKMQIVGNSVARSVALSLGLTLRKSWIKNAYNIRSGKILDDGYYIIPQTCASKHPLVPINQLEALSGEDMMITEEENHSDFDDTLESPTTKCLDKSSSYNELESKATPVGTPEATVQKSSLKRPYNPEKAATYISEQPLKVARISNPNSHTDRGDLSQLGVAPSLPQITECEQSQIETSWGDKEKPKVVEMGTQVPSGTVFLRNFRLHREAVLLLRERRVSDKATQII